MKSVSRSLLYPYYNIFFYLSSTFRKKIRLFLCNFSIDSIYFFDFNILLNYFSCEIYSICARERKENAT